MEKRLKFYSDRLSSTTLEKGEDYCEVQRVISIAILNHKIYKSKKDIYKHNFKLLNTDDHDVYDDNPIEIFIFDRVEKEYLNLEVDRDRLLMYFMIILVKMS